jgi:hypothetical protein
MRGLRVMQAPLRSAPRDCSGAAGTNPPTAGAQTSTKRLRRPLIRPRVSARPQRALPPSPMTPPHSVISVSQLKRPFLPEVACPMHLGPPRRHGAAPPRQRKVGEGHPSRRNAQHTGRHTSENSYSRPRSCGASPPLPHTAAAATHHSRCLDCRHHQATPSTSAVTRAPPIRCDDVV